MDAIRIGCSEPILAEWSDHLAQQAESGRAVWAYFNNDIGGAAIADALMLKTMTLG